MDIRENNAVDGLAKQATKLPVPDCNPAGSHSIVLNGAEAPTPAKKMGLRIQEVWCVGRLSLDDLAPHARYSPHALDTMVVGQYLMGGLCGPMGYQQDTLYPLPTVSRTDSPYTTSLLP